MNRSPRNQAQHKVRRQKRRRTCGKPNASQRKRCLGRRRLQRGKRSRRSEAIALLAALQREGRFVDFLKEELTGYSDAQIGAVARDLHRDCAKVVERMFGIKPLLSEGEGATVEVPAGFDAGRYRLAGNIGGSPPFRGALVHHGWTATTCELPEWVGGETSLRVIAPAEVEVK